ncbi:hypothetical protein [Pseudomonas sp. nanlin1]|uniref:hypothetical protein n=1 Tax=Pseudomonas sp. nanlin1 TaxID=3040605 RepID=UPI00389006E3
MSNFKIGGTLQVRPAMAAAPSRAVQDHLDQALLRAGMPVQHAQTFQRFAERRRLVFGVRPHGEPLTQLWVGEQPLCELDGPDGFYQPNPRLAADAWPLGSHPQGPAALLHDTRLRQLLQEGEMLAMGPERDGVRPLQTLGLNDHIVSFHVLRESPAHWSLWQGREPIRLEQRRGATTCSPAAYELLVLAPLLDYGGPSYASSQASNAAYRRSLGEHPVAVDPACAELAGRIEMILAALDDDAAGIALLSQDIRPRPGGLAPNDFPAMLFLPHPVGDYPAQCPIADRRGLYHLLQAVHDAGLALDIDPGWRTLGY